MTKEFIIYNLMTKEYFCGFHERANKWSEFLYYADHISDMRDVEAIIKNENNGIFQVIEIYSPN